MDDVFLNFILSRILSVTDKGYESINIAFAS